MYRTVHGLFVAIIVSVLCSGICGLRINQEDEKAVTDKYPYNNLDVETLQLVEPFLPDENEVEVIPEDDIGAILTTIEEKQSENEELQKDTIFGEADNAVPKRMKRQATHQYRPLYPQLPSGPPYNPYQPQPNNNPSSQNPNQQQPSYNPYTQNPNQQPPSYNPYTQNPNQQQPSYNPYTQNPNQQQPSFNPSGQNPYPQQPGYNPNSQNATQFPQRPPQWNTNNFNSSQPTNPNYNPNAGFPHPNQSPYSPPAGQNPYNSRPNFPTVNNTSPGIPYRPPNGQYPGQNQTFNPQPNAGSYRPPNASGSSFTTPLAPYNPRPGQPPYNNYPNSPGNSHPVQQFNSTTQRPPYYNPNQYPSYNNSRPNPYPNSQYPNSQYPNSQYPNSQYPNSQYPNYPGARPGQGTYNATSTQTPHVSPYYPGPNGKFPSNSYNPSIPNYPPQNNNQGQNNFFYPQTNSSTSYDPRRVPPQNFSYHY